MKLKLAIFRFRIISALVILAVLVLPLIPAEPAQAYSGNYTKMQSITISDNSGVARASVPVITTISGTTYITSGYINSVGTNTAMVDNSTGVDGLFMMDTTQCTLNILNLPAYGSVVLNLLMGTSTNQTSFPIITGNDGYITVVDSPNLELGDNFTIDLNGEIDTSVVGANLTAKSGAIRTYISGSGNITSRITNSHNLNYDGSNDYAYKAAGVVLPGGAELTMEATFNPDVVNANQAIYSAVEGALYKLQYLTINPTAKIVIYIGNSANDAYAASWTSTNSTVADTWYSVMASYNATATPELRVYVNGVEWGGTDTGDGTNIGIPTTDLQVGAATNAHTLKFNGDIDEVRISGIARTSAEAITNWNNGNPTILDMLDYDYTNTYALWHFEENTGVTTYDMTANNNDLTITGADWVANSIVGVEVTAQNISSDNHTIRIKTNLNADPDLFLIYVDDFSLLHFKGLANLQGVSVPDTDDNWTLMQGNSVKYANYYKHYVDGVLQARYEPTVMLLGTAVVDRATDATNNPGTIHWGTNSGLTITYGSVINAPSVQTNAASGIQAVSAYLYGAVTGLGNNSYVNVGFDYGQDTTYGFGRTPLQNYTTIGTFYYYVSGLSPNTVYHFRAVMAYGVNQYTYGADATFTTMSAPGSSTTILIKDAKMFNDYITPGDLLLVAEVVNNYTNLYPHESPRGHFTVQLLDINNTTILGASPLANWGDRPVSIYWNPTVVSNNITQGAGYYVKMIGDSVSGNASVEYQLLTSTNVTSDWRGSDLTGLDWWCRGTAINMGLVDGADMGHYLTNVTNSAPVINDIGGGFFTMGIPAVGEVRPDLFATAQYKTSIIAGTALNFWDKTDADTVAGWRSYVGTRLAGDVDVLANPFGITGQAFMAGMVMLAMIGVVMVVVGGTGGFGALGAVLIAVPILWLGTYFRIVTISVIMLMVIFFGWWAVRQFIWKTL